MRKFLCAIAIPSIAIMGILFWSGAAWAVLQDTTVTVTDNGQPIPSATITLTRTDKPAEPPKAKAQSDDHGKVSLQYDDANTPPDAKVDVTIDTADGKRREIHDVPLVLVLSGGELDVSKASECMDDAHLKMLLENAKLRERLTSLMRDTTEASKPDTGTEHKADKASKTSSKKVSRHSAVPGSDGVPPQPAGGGVPIETLIGVGVGVGASGVFGGGHHHGGGD